MSLDIKKDSYHIPFYLFHMNYNENSILVKSKKVDHIYLKLKIL